MACLPPRYAKRAGRDNVTFGPNGAVGGPPLMSQLLASGGTDVRVLELYE